MVIDGTVPHWSEPFEGRRISIVAFYHIQQDIYVVVHGEDFLGAATVGKLQDSVLHEAFEVKRGDYIGPGAAGGESGTALAAASAV